MEFMLLGHRLCKVGGDSGSPPNLAPGADVPLVHP